MNRTTTFLGTAVVLSLLAAVAAATSRLHQPQVPTAVVAQAGDEVRVVVRPSHKLAPAGGGELFAELTVSAAPAAPRDEPPVAMAVVLDRSGSMTGEKLERARAAALRLTTLLRPDDELAVVDFGTDVRASARHRMDAAGREAITAHLQGLRADGATNLSAGLEAAGHALSGADGVRRVVLISDGQPTAGVTDERGLTALVGLARDAGLTVTALGVGADYNGLLMQALAERGGGFYGYLQDAGRLEEVLALELGQARGTTVRSVVLELQPGEGVTLADAPGRSVELSGRAMRLHLRDLRPGDSTTVYVRLATEATRGATRGLFGASLRWTAASSDELKQAKASLALAVTDDAGTFERSKDEAVFSAGVRALGAKKMVEAAAALERGDKLAAFSLLGNARALFGMSADALAGDIDETQVLERRWQNVSASQAKFEARGLEKKKLSDFGKENEGY